MLSSGKATRKFKLALAPEKLSASASSVSSKERL